MSNRDIDDMEDIIDPLLIRKRSGKYIATMLARCGFGRLPTGDGYQWGAGQDAEHVFTRATESGARNMAHTGGRLYRRTIGPWEEVK